MCVDQMPSHEEIVSFYQGFLYQINIDNLNKIKKPEIKEWMSSVTGNKRSARMLDVGGGGGFFAKAFEDFGLGEAVVVDLDAKACDFARHDLNLKRVINAPIEQINTTDYGYFDFIYCRHVIEHLVDPVSFIRMCYSLLKPGGIFVVQCPNGTSKEQAFFYPHGWKMYLKKARNENGWSRLGAILRSLMTDYGFGLDPLRHLWAISPKGLENVCSSLPSSTFKIQTASLSDEVFSPYFSSKSRFGIIRDFCARTAVRTFMQGCHLVATIKKNE